MKLRRIYRWSLGMVGILALGTEAIGYYVNRLLALKYFPDQDWIRIGTADAFIALVALYIIFVAASGRWKPWSGS